LNQMGDQRNLICVCSSRQPTVCVMQAYGACHCKECEGSLPYSMVWGCQPKAVLVNIRLAAGEPDFGQFPNRGLRYSEIYLLIQSLRIK
jgi:hypothetical protein